MGVAFHWHGESSTKPKICNLQYPLLLVNQQVLRLQITVKDTMAMAVSNSFA